MNQAPNILKAIKTLWAAASPLAAVTLLPWGKTPSIENNLDTRPPYANLRVNIDKKEWNSGSVYLQQYVVDIKLFVQEDTAALDALATTVASSIDLKQASITSCTVLLVLPETEDQEVSPDEYQGHTMNETVLRWRMLVQQTK